jgi:AcrR family transcriptional regulator
MSPKSLTEQKKESQRQNIIDKAQELIIQYGFKKTSVDDICKAAHIAKGTFYLYFVSKEELFSRLITEFTKRYFLIAEKLIIEENNRNIKSSLKAFFVKIFNVPEILFFFREHDDMRGLTETLLQEDFAAMEKEWINKLFLLANVDTTKAFPEVAHNYMHAIYAAKTVDLMIEEYREATVNLLIDGMIDYIFSGRKE